MTLQLCINADDFGFSEAVDAGIDDAARAGVVTSTSVLTIHGRAPSVGRLPMEVSVGLHFALTGPAAPSRLRFARPPPMGLHR